MKKSDWTGKVREEYTESVDIDGETVLGVSRHNGVVMTGVDLVSLKKEDSIEEERIVDKEE